jgi:hypothetical protein
MNSYIDRIFYATGGYTVGAKYYFRIVRRADASIWDTVAEVMSATTTWENSTITMTEKSTTGAFPVVIPADFPPDTYDIVVYTQAGSSPANTDNVEDSYNVKVGSIFGF